MVADELDYVVGVDTHLDEHVLAVVVAPARWRQSISPCEIDANDSE
jgi:hypothetical protein